MPFPAFFNVHCIVHCMLTVCSLYVHCMFTVCALHAHCMCSVCSLLVDCHRTCTCSGASPATRNDSPRRTAQDLGHQRRAHWEPPTQSRINFILSAACGQRPCLTLSHQPCPELTSEFSAACGPRPCLTLPGRHNGRPRLATPPPLCGLVSPASSHGNITPGARGPSAWPRRRPVHSDAL